MDTAIERKEIEALIQSKSDRITYEDCGSKHKIFRKVLVDGSWSKFVKCNLCSFYVVKYASGANGIIHHEKSQHATHDLIKMNQPKIDQFIPIKLTHQDRIPIYRASAVCCATDFLPLSYTQKKGFKRLIKAIVKLDRAKGGRVSIEDLLPTHSTNIKYVHVVATEV